MPDWDLQTPDASIWDVIAAQTSELFDTLVFDSNVFADDVLWSAEQSAETTWETL